ncbi:hypothetical protein [Paenibacillus glacialis]|uniref:Uncharacterized protein n=1 Tax=Paenibacillus glacialis TaxID=494026 RepID=A0A162LY89_9BACL|nr:hypothetical protein [Paenibacillus glacialis]OAB36023.1 hypothetical protein PGLA_21615 [Paenibacillus glacialis]
MKWFLTVEVDIIKESDELHKSSAHRLEHANVYGALATQFQGDWAGLPKLTELELMLQGKKQTTR